VVGAVVLDAGNIEGISLFSWLTMQLFAPCKWLFPRLFYSTSRLFGQELRDQAERIKAIGAHCFPA
jgi:hypothetical protein